MTTERLKVILGFSLGFFLVLSQAALAAVIALAHVEAQTSHGLQIVLGSLSTLAGGFAGWAFGPMLTSANSETRKDNDNATNS